MDEIAEVRELGFAELEKAALMGVGALIARELEKFARVRDDEPGGSAEGVIVLRKVEALEAIELVMKLTEGKAVKPLGGTTILEVNPRLDCNDKDGRIIVEVLGILEPLEGGELFGEVAEEDGADLLGKLDDTAIIELAAMLCGGGLVNTRVDNELLEEVSVVVKPLEDGLDSREVSKLYGELEVLNEIDELNSEEVIELSSDGGLDNAEGELLIVLGVPIGRVIRL